MCLQTENIFRRQYNTILFDDGDFFDLLRFSNLTVRKTLWAKPHSLEIFYKIFIAQLFLHKEKLQRLINEQV